MFLLAMLACHGPDVRNEAIEMRDGAGLATDVYLPRGDGPFPVVLTRTPYGRWMGRLLSRDLEQQGYALVAQDTRGRGASEGVDCVFRCEGDGELQDGFDTLSWIDAQPWSDGHVVSWGPSALGIAQYLTAPTGAPGLAGIDVSVATGNFYEDAVLPGGAYRQSLVEGWLEAQGSLFFLDEVALHLEDPAWWAPTKATDDVDQVEVPGLHVAGWYDIFLAGTLNMFVGIQEQGGEGARGQQRLVVGPWTHVSMNVRAQGELRYPEGAEGPVIPVTELEKALRDHVAPSAEGPQASVDWADVPAVQYYVMGDVDDPEAPGNAWREAEAWPISAAPTRWHLRADGSLSEACPADGEGETAYVSDPLDPVPTVCGANLNIAAGPCDQAELDARADVLVFETPVLDAPMEVTGPLRARLHLSLDQVDTDLILRVSDVYPDGRAMLLLDGAARVASREDLFSLAPVEPGAPIALDVQLAPTSVVLNAGHRLRLAVSSSSAPRYAVNRNTGLPLFDMLEGEPLPVTVSLRHEAGAASYLELPMPEREAGDVTVCGD
ncbi:MAG: CocE/NonD family hydrolase [Alphaproteobacteria bacterium]|nr:CocE/NonD family hydrolase [Alphaproteobacteria bacterium]